VKKFIEFWEDAYELFNEHEEDFLLRILKELNRR
jgi:hypothetical protein